MYKLNNNRKKYVAIFWMSKYRLTGLILNWKVQATVDIDKLYQQWQKLITSPWSYCCNELSPFKTRNMQLSQFLNGKVQISWWNMNKNNNIRLSMDQKKMLIPWMIFINIIKLMKGKTLRKHSLHGKTTASVLLKLFISSNEWCHTTDAP